MVQPASLLDTLLVSVLAGGIATTLGGAPVMVLSSLRRSLEATLMGFGAGVMLAASGFSLLLPAIAGASLRHEPQVAVLIVAAGFLSGGALISIAHKHFPHEHFFKGAEGPGSKKLSRLWLFVIAITIHNFPEGLAIGAAFGAGAAADSVPLAVGIGIQNLPEGLVVAVALIAAGYSRTRALLVTAATGFVEPVGALVGHLGVQIATLALPVGLGFAAGAMIFVVSDEIIPESHREHGEGRATLGLMIGFALMMVLDVALA